MNVIKGAMELTQMDLPDDTDQDNIAHFIDLREHILENITCIFSAIKDINQTKEFIPYVNGIIKYINKISQDSLCSSLSILTQSLFLIGDFCFAYKQDLLPLLDKLILENMINKIENDKVGGKDPKILQGLEWAKNIINGIFGMK